jgi:hypothetical protein
MTRLFVTREAVKQSINAGGRPPEAGTRRSDGTGRSRSLLAEGHRSYEQVSRR